jgi:hypothetical protein
MKGEIVMSFKPWGTEGAKVAIQDFYTQLRGFLAKDKPNYQGIRRLYPDDTVIIAGTSGMIYKGKDGAVAFWRGLSKKGIKVKFLKINKNKVYAKKIEAIVRVGEVYKREIEKVYYLAKISHNSPDVVEWFSGIANHGEECCINGIYEAYIF